MSRRPKTLFQLFFAWGVAIIVAGLSGVSYLKAVKEISTSGHHAGPVGGWMLSAAAPLIQFLQVKSLWELIPAFQSGTPLSLSNVPFWTAVFLLVRAAKMTSKNFSGLRSSEQGHGSAWASLLRTRFFRPGPVTNYMFMINGPITNTITAHTVGAVQQQSVEASTADGKLDRVATDLERLLLAIAKDRSLAEEKKKDARELIATIAEEAKRPERERKPAVIKAVLSAIPAVISTAKSAVELWSEIQPYLASLFL